MPKKSFTVLIVPHDHRGALRQVSMSRRFFAGSVSVLLLLFGLALAVPAYLSRSAPHAADAPAVVSAEPPAPLTESEALRQARAKNRDLREQVFALGRKVEALTRSMEEFEAISDIRFDTEAAGVGGTPEDPMFDFENPEFFQDEPATLAQVEMEKAEFWTALIQERIQDRVILAGSRPSIFPVRGGLPTHGYRWRTDPFTHKPAFHRGLDIAARRGTPVIVTADGIVTFCGWQGGYGNTLEINHSYGTSTRYGHLDRFLVRKGQRVSKGEIIGEVGSTGRSTGPHLHYEVLEYGRAMNPMFYIYDERSEMVRR